MNFITISIKNTLPTSPIVLSKDSENRLLLRREANETYLDTIDTTLDNILIGMGSSVGNVLFLFDSGFQIDSSLESHTEKGFLRLKEPEQIMMIDVTKTVLGTDEITSYFFDHYKTAKRFVEKKIFGEIYLLKSAEQETLPFYPHLREAYLLSSNWIEVGIAGFLNCGNSLVAPSATITELTVAPTDKQLKKAENVNAVFELSLWKRFRLDFIPGSGMNVIRMIRGKNAVKDGDNKVYWEIHNEIFKIYVG